MRFAGIHRSFLLSGFAVDASCAVLGAWLRLQSFASSDEVESERIAGARSWNERRWLVNCQLSPAEVSEVVEANLARWQGDDLVIYGFDNEGVDAVRARRDGGKLGAAHGSKGGRPKKTPTKPLSGSELNPSGVISANPSRTPLSSPLLSSPLPSLPLPSLPSEVSVTDLGGFRKPYRVGTMTPAFLSVFDRYPRKDKRIPAAQVFQEIADDYPGGEAALAAAIAAAFDAGMLKRHPYSGDNEHRPCFDTVLEERRWEDPASAPDDKSSQSSDARDEKLDRAIAARGGRPYVGS